MREVLLYSENTHALVASTWSQADGTYRFERIDPQQRYTVISTDYQQLYRAAVADRRGGSLNVLCCRPGPLVWAGFSR